MNKCQKCNGTGEITVPVEEHMGKVLYGKEQCDECGGTGEINPNEVDRFNAVDVIKVIRVKKMGYRKWRSDIPTAPFYRNDFRVFMVVRGNKIPAR